MVGVGVLDGEGNPRSTEYELSYHDEAPFGSIGVALPACTLDGLSGTLPISNSRGVETVVGNLSIGTSRLTSRPVDGVTGLGGTALRVWLPTASDGVYRRSPENAALRALALANRSFEPGRAIPGVAVVRPSLIGGLESGLLFWRAEIGLDLVLPVRDGTKGNLYPAFWTQFGVGGRRAALYVDAGYVSCLMCDTGIPAVLEVFDCPGCSDETTRDVAAMAAGGRLSAGRVSCEARFSVPLSSAMRAIVDYGATVAVGVHF